MREPRLAAGCDQQHLSHRLCFMLPQQLLLATVGNSTPGQMPACPAMPRALSTPCCLLPGPVLSPFPWLCSAAVSPAPAAVQPS